MLRAPPSGQLEYLRNWWARALLPSRSVLSGVRLCDPMDRATPGFPVPHCLPEFAQTHVRWVGDAIQPSHPLSLAFSRQEYWSGLPRPPPEDLADSGIDPGLPCRRWILYHLSSREDLLSYVRVEEKGQFVGVLQFWLKKKKKKYSAPYLSPASACALLNDCFLGLFFLKLICPGSCFAGWRRCDPRGAPPL